MLLRFEAINGGAKFSEIAEEVILLDIIEDPAEMNVQTSPLAGGPGMLVSSATRKSLTVRLVYVIREMDPVRRAELRDKVARWAYQASLLEINTRPGKCLSAKAYIPTAQGSSLRWTDELSLTFTAYELPYWFDSQISMIECTTDDFKLTGARAITPTGADVPIPISCYVTVMGSEKLTDLLLRVGNTKLQMRGLNIASGSMLMVESLTGHDLTIRDVSTGQSYLGTRTEDSSDALMALPNVPNPLHAEANVKCMLMFYWSGWWL
jgi:hypothetical protein